MKRRYSVEYRGLKDAKSLLVREYYSDRWQRYGRLMICPLRVKELVRDFSRRYRENYEFRVRLVMVDETSLDPIGEGEIVDVETI